MHLLPTWNHYFENLESNLYSNQNLLVFASATILRDDTTDTDIIRTQTEDIDIIIMTVAPFTGNIKFLHSIRNLGGTRIRPKHKLVPLDGFGDDATPTIISAQALSGKLEIFTPSYNSIRTLSSISAIHNTTSPTTG